MHCRPLLTVVLFVPFLLGSRLWAQEPLIKADNPDPAALPTLSVHQRDALLLVRAAFPNVPDFACDAWCYESAMDCIGIRAIEGGRIELTHRDREHPRVLYVTVVTPEPGAVDFRVRVERAPGTTEPLPDRLVTPNLCWQLIPAPGFASAPDPYPDFVKRCFIFTDKGRTFLHETRRGAIPVRPATDKENNPPWVQMYVGEWQEVPETSPTSWAAYSRDRYLTPVIGAESRDGRYLAALVNDTATGMAQAWHDCMHNNAQWAPASAPVEERTWHVKVYVMENSPRALLERATRDFPELPGADKAKAALERAGDD